MEELLEVVFSIWSDLRLYNKVVARAQQGGVRRRQNSGCHKNCIKTHEAKWLLKFISPADYDREK
jgi:hypothetical protein